MFKRKKKGAQKVMLVVDPQKVEALEKRVKQLEFSHTHGWKYSKHAPQYMVMDGHGNYVHFTYHKECKECGKKVEHMLHNQWLQEQADEAYKKHEAFVEQINELNTETEK